ncbi:MAG: NADH-ubiquinone oxidoreductase-F iron-sulfur binding region domain-containing protein, partial [Planctomycetota bacterium]
GMIVMDDHTCMVDVAKYFIKFLTEESCGKCTPCREGLLQLHHILNEICEGRGKNGDLEKIKALSQGIIAGSLCALGKSAPNPVLSTIHYFEDEYRTHIENRKCPAGVCRELTTYVISSEACTGCMLCAKICPVEAISGTKKKPHTIDQKKCTQCGACRTVCKFDAVLTE